MVKAPVIAVLKRRPRQVLLTAGAYVGAGTSPGAFFGFVLRLLLGILVVGRLRGVSLKC